MFFYVIRCSAIARLGKEGLLILPASVASKSSLSSPNSALCCSSMLGTPTDSVSFHSKSIDGGYEGTGQQRANARDRH
jgi:hypothetical protein